MLIGKDTREGQILDRLFQKLDRMRAALGSDRVFMRSLATRQAHRALSQHIVQSIGICQAAGFDLIWFAIIVVKLVAIGVVDATDVDQQVAAELRLLLEGLEHLEQMRAVDLHQAFVNIGKDDPVNGGGSIGRGIQSRRLGRLADHQASAAHGRVGPQQRGRQR